jgi:enoyl-[acyl-carrier protein] reductase I
MTYLGSMRAIPRYNIMGVAKASLEACIRYLAADLGPGNIRVNGISAGPINTLAARGIPGFTDILHHYRQKTPLRRNIEASEVGDAAAFLLSSYSRGITGEVLFVDAGYHICGI